MAESRKFGNTKPVRKNAAVKREQYNFWTLPFPELTLADMPEFKNLLYKAITTEETFMVYNGRKYCKEYARFVIKVIEQEGR